MPEPLRGHHVEHCQRYYESPSTRPMGIDLSLAGRRRDGSELPVEISLSPVSTPDGVLVISVIRDMTERRRVEEEIRTLNDTLACRVAEFHAVNKELEAFSYSVSHDLRAPLRSMDGFSQALSRTTGIGSTKSAADYLRRIRGGHPAHGRADRRSPGSLPRHPPGADASAVDLCALAHAVLAGLARAEPERQVEMDIAAGLMGQGDPHLLRVVLENLLGNAWKFTAGEPPARIEFGARQDGEPPVYYVRDNGVGLRHGYADKLFGAFQRLHPGRRVSGHGDRAGHRAAHRAPAWRAGLGAERGRAGRDLLLHARRVAGPCAAQRVDPPGGRQPRRRGPDAAGLAQAESSTPLVVARDGVEALDYLFGTGAHAGAIGLMPRLVICST